VRELVCDQALPVGASRLVCVRGKHDAPPDRVRTSLHRPRGFTGFRVGVHLDIAQVGTEQWLHDQADQWVERASRTPEHVLDDWRRE
jgi:hypothetical protein